MANSIWRWSSGEPPNRVGRTSTHYQHRHLAHWTVWDKWDLYDRSIQMYQDFLPSSIERAKHQGYQGARLGKMSDPSGRSAPGEINSLLIWQQPHSMWFAEMEYRKSPTAKTIQKWDRVLTEVADFMASYAWYNQSTKVYDLGPRKCSIEIDFEVR